MKTLRRTLLALALSIGVAACGSTSIAGPHMPDAGNHMPDAGNHMPDAGNHMPDAGNIG